MAARLDSVAKFICAADGWRVTNLQLQKILYLAQMIHMGRTDGARLAKATFEAWDLGPVEPSLYKKVRMFGSGGIQNVFFDARRFGKDDPRRKTLEDACETLLPLRASELVEITHWEDGAWAKYYEPGIRGTRIPDQAILTEYKDRISSGVLTED